MTALHLHESSTPLVDDEVLTAARAMNLSPGGGAGPAQRMAALYKPDIDPDELTRLVAAEPVLAARTLKVANSAYYRRSGEVGTVARAVQVLGTATVKGIAAAACLDRVVSVHPGLPADDAARLRLHSLAVACAGQALARQARPALEAEAFMAGVLHDIGVLVQWALRPVAMAHWSAAPDSGSELSTIGTTHARCGLLVMRAWQLPQWLQSAVAHHHDDALPDDPQAADVCALLRLAEAVATAAGFGMPTELLAGTPGDTIDADPATRALAAEHAHLGLDSTRLEALQAKLPALLEPFAAAG